MDHLEVRYISILLFLSVRASGRAWKRGRARSEGRAPRPRLLSDEMLLGQRGADKDGLLIRPLVPHGVSFVEAFRDRF